MNEDSAKECIVTPAERRATAFLNLIQSLQLELQIDSGAATHLAEGIHDMIRAEIKL